MCRGTMLRERGQVHVGFPAVGVSRGGPEDGLGALTVPTPSFLHFHFYTPFLFSSLLSSELEWTRRAGTENDTVTHVARGTYLGGEVFFYTQIS